MKKQIFAVLSIILILIYPLSGCSNGNSPETNAEKDTAVITTEVGSFSYETDSSRWVPGETGMKSYGFNNTAKNKINSAKDALNLAENEVTVTYNQTAVSYDKETQIWKVEFWAEDMNGGNQIVYLNSDGTTKMCIWEE